MANYLLFCVLNGLYFGLSFGFDLTILHTNDVHAHFQQFAARGGQCIAEDATNGECYGGEARRFTKVNEIRQSNQNVLLLDAGDRFVGTLWFTEYKGLAASLFMNRLQYDVMCFGNHEFDTGVEGLVPFLNNLTTPVVSANIDASGEPRLQGKFSKSVTLTVGGERVGVVGYTTKETNTIANPGETLTFTDEVSAVRDEVAVLRGQGVNKIIALGHAGFDKDKEIAAIEDVDIVVGGHSNTMLYNVAPGEDEPYEDPQGPYPVVVTRSSGSRALVVQDYVWAKYLGHLDVTFDDNGDIVTYSGNPILLDNSVPEDAGTLQLINKMAEPLLALQTNVIGQAAVTLDGDRVSCRLQECTMGNFLTDALVHHFVNFEHPNTSWASAAIAIWNGGGIRSSIAKGDVTVGNVLEVLPFGNEVDRVTVRGSTIRDILEHSVSMYDPAQPHGVFMQMSGLKVVYNMSMTVGHRVRSIHVRCIECDELRYSLLDYAAEYKLFTSSFIISGGDGYSMIGDDKLSHERFNVLAADILREYLEKHSPVYQSLDNRIDFRNDYIISGSPGALYQAADVSYIVSALSRHFSKPRISAGGGTSYKELAKVFIYEEFKKCGLKTSYQDCTGTAEPCTNVVGVLEGERFGKATDNVMGIGGNYDTDTFTNSSGVNENGAGVAAMLEVARQLTKGATKRQNTILFVAFDRHYTDFQGSRSFIADWLNPWLGRNYGAAAQTLPAYGVIVVNSLMKYTSAANSHEFPARLDALKKVFPETMQNIAADNFTGDFLSLVYRKLERTRDTFLASTFKKFWAGEGNTEFELETFPLPMGSVSDLQNNEATRPFMDSEHAVFWQDNIPSIFLSDLGRMRGRVADDMSHMLAYDNIRFLAKTTDVIAKTMDKLSEPLTSHVVTTGATDITTVSTDTATCKGVINAATSVNSFMMATNLAGVLAYSSTIW